MQRSRSLEYIHRELAKYEREFKQVDLSRYYQLKKTPYESIEVNKEVLDGCIQVTVVYRNKSQCRPLLQIPPEMMAKIRSYLTYKIELKVKIQYSENYPFSPPIWFLNGVTPHTIPNQVNLTDYYSYKVSCHNNQYRTEWTPAIAIEKDILTFIQKINHFDEMLVSV